MPPHSISPTARRRKIENLFNALQSEYLHRKAQRNDLNGLGRINLADVQRVAELYQDNRKLFAELDAEKARLKDELLAEMRNSPNLQAQVESFGGFDRFSDDWLSMVERYALRMGASQDPVETMRRVTLDEAGNGGPVCRQRK